ncbi:hypothetical protein [Aliiglaciecola sp. LCG003]|uniref:hypothetical protein n=1 Tax=Aliiglaciecola sp. LCG003 TaxID=3053655 RepID=UPI002572B5EC|nr:hypothetical protein [Aliiglaciecola sp. LCG003]WJG11063.1 hypothetical protein QR722_08565 [Aliiglaciecola sp. LCG003]
MKKLLLALGLLSASLTANATLVGTEVSCNIEPSAIYFCHQPTETVAEGAAEFFIDSLFSSEFALDFDATSLQIEYLGIELLAEAGEFLSLTIMPGLFDSLAFNVVSGVTGVELSDFSFDGETLEFDFNNTLWSEGSVVIIDLIENAGPDPVPMPNAPTALLMLAGLVGLRRLAKK